VDADCHACNCDEQDTCVRSVARLPGKTETGKEIALQGNVVHEVPEFLAEAYGVDSSFVDCKSRSKAG